jgi:hypothetical protein
MGRKTGKQIFETVLLPLINNKVKVKNIILNSDPEFNFEVCDAKWMKKGQAFEDKDGFFWGVGAVDYENNIVYASRPSALAILEYGDIIEIQLPTFRSGTPKSVEGEELAKIQADQITITPIIWLLESVPSERRPYGEPQDEIFDFTFFCLERYSFEDHFNDQRHVEGIYPMKQLGSSLIDGIDSVDSVGIERESAVQQLELSRFGSESDKGFERYILSIDLSGMRYKVKVKIEEQLCCC